MNAFIQAQLDAAEELRDAADAMTFGPSVEAVYNPLRYAWAPFAVYVRRFGAGPKRAVFLGMNPGPWGMAQTGIPFGEVEAVRDWMKINEPVGKPERGHPAYPVLGLDCPRSEVSGRRLWGLFRARFGDAETFFSEYFVVNYCPLLFIAPSPRPAGGRPGGRNLTPDRLPSGEREALYHICGRHLASVLEALRPEFVVGIGAFAEARASEVVRENHIKTKIIRILHPSPASPMSNRDWPGTVTRSLVEAGVWSG